MGCCGGGNKTVSVRRKRGVSYFNQFDYLTPAQLKAKREQENVMIWCAGCEGGKECPAKTFFSCEKRIQLGL